MPKRAARTRIRSSRDEDGAAVIKPRHVEERRLPPILPKTAKQSDCLKALRMSDQVVAIGCAGTGKTWVAATFAATWFREGKVSKIVLTKPNVPGGRSIGCLPGTADEKMAPWVTPLTEAIKERIGAAAFEIAMKQGDIEIAPFEVMRGRAFKDCFVIFR